VPTLEAGDVPRARVQPTKKRAVWARSAGPSPKHSTPLTGRGQSPHRSSHRGTVLDIARTKCAVIYCEPHLTAGFVTAHAGLAQLVEQLFRKQQVAGSSPAVGSGQRQSPGRMHAEVAEPADALRSGRSARKGVGVQISPSAPGSRSGHPGPYVYNRGRRGKDGRWRIRQRKVRAAQSKGAR
jgi:hypothetical protein